MFSSSLAEGRHSSRLPMVLGWHDWNSSLGPFATDKESCVNMWTDSLVHRCFKIPRLEAEMTNPLKLLML